MKTKILYIALVILAGAILVYSCSKGSSSTPSSTPTGNTASATIQNMIFGPDPLTVTAGTTVTWKNNDGVPHTVTSLSNAFDSGNIGAGASYSFTFTTAGTYTYHCLVHSMMKTATVVVTN